MSVGVKFVDDSKTSISIELTFMTPARLTYCIVALYLTRCTDSNEFIDAEQNMIHAISASPSGLILNDASIDLICYDSFSITLAIGYNSFIEQM